MEVMDKSRVWKSLKQRLGLKRMGCCGAIFGPGTEATAANPTTITIIETLNLEDDEDAYPSENDSRRSSAMSAPPYLSQDPSAAVGMNLAMALAAERNLRAAGPGAAGRVKTLMALIEETDGVDLKVGRRRRERRSGAGAGGGLDGVCCVCMERSKGAAFIPCGHTYCRPCSRELWISRGSCPVCNCSILEVLDIF